MTERVKQTRSSTMTSSVQSRWLVDDSPAVVLTDRSPPGECFKPTVLPPVGRWRDESSSWQHKNTRDSESWNIWNTWGNQKAQSKMLLNGMHGKNRERHVSLFRPTKLKFSDTENKRRERRTDRRTNRQTDRQLSWTYGVSTNVCSSGFAVRIMVVYASHYNML